MNALNALNPQKTLNTVACPDLRVWIDGIGVIAPGMPNWPSAREVLRGERDFVSAPTVLLPADLLPTAERRRASRVIKLGLGVGLEAVCQAGADPSTLATVFAASGADGHNCHALCEQLAGVDRQISPTRFHNSVHNACAGYWGIATRSMAPSQVIAAFDASFCAGLLDALAQVVCDTRQVLLVTYDSEYPQPLHAKRNTPDCGGVAFLLSPQPSAVSVASITLSTTAQVAEAMSNAALEALRQDIPALRALPLLQALAKEQAATVVLEYLAPVQLRLELQPC